MIEEIVCKFYNTKYNIGVDANGKYFGLINGKVKTVNKEFHCGSIHYRIKGSSKRVSAKKLNDSKFIVVNYKIQHYTPF